MATKNIQIKTTSTSKIKVIISTLSPFVHAFVIPLILAFSFQWFAVLYWIVPTTAYLTIAKEQQLNAIRFFYSIAIVIILMAASFADEPLANKPTEVQYETEYSSM